MEMGMEWESCIVDQELRTVYKGYCVHKWHYTSIMPTNYCITRAEITKEGLEELCSVINANYLPSNYGNVTGHSCRANKHDNLEYCIYFPVSTLEYILSRIDILEEYVLNKMRASMRSLD